MPQSGRTVEGGGGSGVNLGGVTPCSSSSFSSSSSSGAGGGGGGATSGHRPISAFSKATGWEKSTGLHLNDRLAELDTKY